MKVIFFEILNNAKMKISSLQTRLIAAGLIMNLFLFGYCFAGGESNLKINGELSYDGRIGNFEKNNGNQFLLNVLKYTYANYEQIFTGIADVENLRTISEKQILDIKNNFYGVSGTPQDLDFKNISHYYDDFSLNYGISHNKRTISAFYADGFINNYSMSVFKDFGKKDLKFGYLLDHAMYENLFYTLKFEQDSSSYNTHSADDYNYRTASFKILHKMPKISRTPSYFSGYIFDKTPIVDDPEFIHYMDLTYELKAEAGVNNSQGAVQSSFDNFKIDYSVKFDLSKISNVILSGYNDRRTYKNESLAGYFFNYEKSFINFAYAHALSQKMIFMPYIDFTKYNYLNFSGYNTTEYGAGGYFSYKCSPKNRWNFDIKNSQLTPFESKINYPSNRKTNFVSDFIHYIDERKRLIFDIDYEVMRVGLNESVYNPAYDMYKSELRYEQKISENFYARCGFGGSSKKHENFPVNDINDIYCMTGLSLVF